MTHAPGMKAGALVLEVGAMTGHGVAEIHDGKLVRDVSEEAVHGAGAEASRGGVLRQAALAVAPVRAVPFTVAPGRSGEMKLFILAPGVLLPWSAIANNTMCSL